MTARVKVIQRARESASSANRKSRRESKQRDAEKQRVEQELRETAQLKLADKLASIRHAREEEIRKLQEGEELAKKRNAFLGAAKEMVEAKVFKELLYGAERESRQRQFEKRYDATRYEDIKDRANNIRETNRNNEMQAIYEKRNARNIELESKLSKQKDYAITKAKRSLANKEKERYRTQATKTINVYATSIDSDLPLKVIQSMNREQLGVFYHGRTRAVERAFKKLFSEEITFDATRPTSPTNAGTLDDALDSIHTAISSS